MSFLSSLDPRLDRLQALRLLRYTAEAMMLAFIPPKGDCIPDMALRQDRDGFKLGSPLAGAPQH